LAICSTDDLDIHPVEIQNKQNLKRKTSTNDRRSA